MGKLCCEKFEHNHNIKVSGLRINHCWVDKDQFMSEGPWFSRGSHSTWLSECPRASSITSSGLQSAKPPAQGRASPGIGFQKSASGLQYRSAAARRGTMYRYLDRHPTNTEYPGFQTLGERASAPSFLTDSHLSLLTPARHQPRTGLFHWAHPSTDHQTQSHCARRTRAKAIPKS